MRVGDMVSPEAYALSPDDTLREAARLMADLDAAALPVGENDQLIGTITHRDINEWWSKAEIRKRSQWARRCPRTLYGSRQA